MSSHHHGRKLFVEDVAKMFAISFNNNNLPKGNCQFEARTKMIDKMQRHFQKTITQLVMTLVGNWFHLLLLHISIDILTLNVHIECSRFMRFFNFNLHSKPIARIKSHFGLISIQCTIHCILFSSNHIVHCFYKM